MSRLRTDHILVTDEELHALLDTEPSAEPSPVQPPTLTRESSTHTRVDPWFKFRNFFLLTLISAFCIKLLFSPIWLLRTLPTMNVLLLI